MKKEILSTLGPASMNKRVITRLDELGVSLFRINLAHTDIRDLPGVIQTIQKYSSVPICLDTEGAQIRTGKFVEKEIFLKENSIVYLKSRRVPGDSREFNLNPMDIIHTFQVSDLLSIDFNSVLIQIIETGEDFVTARVVNGGLVGRNKAANLDREISLPPLTVKDKEALKIGKKAGINHVALSFTNRAEDVDTIREVAGNKIFLISKIESRNGLKNLEQIASKSDAILLDRGDMSREVSIEKIPPLQKAVIQQVKRMGKKIYVATNLLESMVSAKGPTRAEVNDVYNTLMDGADGLVLAAETAVGAHPIECAGMILKLIHEYEREDQSDHLYYSSAPFSFLIEPHGGRLVNRVLPQSERERLDRLKCITVRETDLYDCEHIANGAYSPLTGFMVKEVLEMVLNENRLPDGSVWTLPIVLQVPLKECEGLGVGDRVLLKDTEGAGHSIMDIKEIYRINLDDVAQKWFQTTSHDHPGVMRLASNGEVFIGGDITLVEKLANTFHNYELSPLQSRLIFTQKGWSRVVGFHTRNVIHRVHEYIQKMAMERCHADGLYVSPVIGPKKRGDFLPIHIMKSYQMMMDFGLYPEGKVVVGSFLTFSRYSGPREAVFTALRHKNMGCSHFIIGRDHTGVGDFYKSTDYEKYFADLGDIGVHPIFFDAIGYNPHDDCYDNLANGKTIEPISGTQVRDALKKNQPIPDWFMHDIIQDMLRDEIQRGNELFVE